MPGGEDGDWLSRGIGGALRRSAEAFLRRRMDVSDARRAGRLRAGYDLDERGLPIGSIPAAFIESRDEARMVYPGAREVFRTASGASGSILVRILSFDDVPAKLSAGYMATASRLAVLDWFQGQLEARGWQSRPRRGAPKLAGTEGWDALQGVDRGDRESFSVKVPTAGRARLVADHRGVGWPPPPGRTYFEVDYRILVEHPWDKRSPQP